MNATAQSSSDVAAVLSDMPAHDQQAFNQSMEAMGALGESELQNMAVDLQSAGQGDPTPVKYALNGFAGYVMQPGKETLRSRCVQAYGQALDKLSRRADKQFLIRQLQLMGEDDAVPFIQPFLKDDSLVHSAAQALATIHTPAAEQALMSALQDATGNRRTALVEALGDFRSSAALPLITPLAKSEDTALRKVALYALANTGNPASARTLSRAARDDGYGFDADNATSDYLLYVRRLLEAGERKTAGKMIRTLVKKTGKHREAAVHLAALRFRKQWQHPDSSAHKINELTSEEKKDGFKLLFDGRDLDGWVGNKKGYLVEDGNIVVNPAHGSGGNLYTAGQYANFIFRFQFQLTPGANNGIGIRAPLQGDAAYVGMEIQVLDNTAAVYKNLHNYQYHGSVYGVIPAKHGYLKPVGQWNEEEIRAVGPEIQVTLNGHVIVKGNIDKASENGTADHKQHPGLKNKTGHIGFLGHGSVVHFRDVRIRDLGAE
jgi:hypothetical protein